MAVTAVGEEEEGAGGRGSTETAVREEEGAGGRDSAEMAASFSSCLS